MSSTRLVHLVRNYSVYCERQGIKLTSKIMKRITCKACLRNWERHLERKRRA